MTRALPIRTVRVSGDIGERTGHPASAHPRRDVPPTDAKTR